MSLCICLKLGIATSLSTYRYSYPMEQALDRSCFINLWQEPVDLKWTWGYKHLTVMFSRERKINIKRMESPRTFHNVFRMKPFKQVSDKRLTYRNKALRPVIIDNSFDAISNNLICFCQYHPIECIVDKIVSVTYPHFKNIRGLAANH